MLIEGSDYIIYSIPMSGPDACAVRDTEGYYTIYTNANKTRQEQAEGVRHELEHLEGDDFDSEKCADQIEYEVRQKK